MDLPFLYIYVAMCERDGDKINKVTTKSKLHKLNQITHDKGRNFFPFKRTR